MKLTRELFIASKTDAIKVNDPEYAKMHSMQPVDMLNEVEQMINKHL